MTAGLIAILVALAAATAFGVYWKSRNGRVVSQDLAASLRAGQGGGASQRAVIERPATAGGPAPARSSQRDPGSRPGSRGEHEIQAGRDGLSSDDLGAPLGSRATLVQFSSSFCAPCRATRRILADVADMVDGVTHVEIDAESRLDLVRRLGVRRTPTTFVLGPDGEVTHRASGQPRKADVIAALGTAA